MYLLDVSQQDKLIQDVTYLAIDFALCAPVLGNMLSNMKYHTLRVLQYRSSTSAQVYIHENLRLFV